MKKLTTLALALLLTTTLALTGCDSKKNEETNNETENQTTTESNDKTNTETTEDKSQENKSDESSKDNSSDKEEEQTATESDDKKDSENKEQDSSSAENNASGLGGFSSFKLDDKEYTEDFKSYKLTILNVFSINCGPCMAELPELAELSPEMQKKNVNFIGVCLEFESDGKVAGEAKDVLNPIFEKAGHTLTIITPDDILLNNLLAGIQAIPYSVFVDSKGNIVGDPIVGSLSKDAWSKAIDEKLAQIK